jgi:hypothetical protein
MQCFGPDGERRQTLYFLAAQAAPADARGEGRDGEGDAEVVGDAAKTVTTKTILFGSTARRVHCLALFKLILQRCDGNVRLALQKALHQSDELDARGQNGADPKSEKDALRALEQALKQAKGKSQARVSAVVVTEGRAPSHRDRSAGAGSDHGSRGEGQHCECCSRRSSQGEGRPRPAHGGRPCCMCGGKDLPCNNNGQVCIPTKLVCSGCNGKFHLPGNLCRAPSCPKCKGIPGPQYEVTVRGGKVLKFQRLAWIFPECRCRCNDRDLPHKRPRTDVKGDRADGAGAGRDQKGLGASGAPRPEANHHGGKMFD